MRAYYNEIDEEEGEWLRRLIAAGLLPAGDVDTRSIEDVCSDELKPYNQCHFFAGVGLWPLALRQAGWPDDRPVWTGSCPCQPFSQAGQGKGFDDERHLWPAWHWLIGQCRPPVVFGEQVAGSDAARWLDLVQADVEALGYALGAVPYAAAGVGAPQRRQRLYWVADAEGGQQSGTGTGGTASAGTAGGHSPHSPVAGWSDARWLYCRDGRTRPLEPGVHPLAPGRPGHLVELRAYGNGLCVPAARAFVEAYLDR
ncbi:DNA cytosine methyltransferase [Devosia sp.]|uniref:DNA cytosine methyltransferase n=1 Tax=Devosia sp. TaxID=1871048 RepID=UPI002AFF3313|nr:DNA cytosine methyltransferase [Devosia sp.]